MLVLGDAAVLCHVRRIGWLMDKDEKRFGGYDLQGGLTGAVGLARVDRGPKPTD